MRSELPEAAPNQYPPGRCRADLGGCGRPLSTYNPYEVCGPCRVRAASNVDEAASEAEDAEAAAGGTLFAWERFPRRTPLRRGPLLVGATSEAPFPVNFPRGRVN